MKMPRWIISAVWFFGLVAVVGTAMSVISSAQAQDMPQRARAVHGDVCPAPELVRTHMVLDQTAQYAEFNGPYTIPPVIGGRRIVPDEPQSSDEVLATFRTDYGLEVPAEEFVYASTMQNGSMICAYRSDVVEPLISIRTRSTTCSPLTGPWGPNGSVQRCDASRRSCLFRC